MVIWDAKSGTPVEILVRLEDNDEGGLAWFWLKQEIGGREEDIGRALEGHAVGQAAYQIPSQKDEPGVQAMYLNLRIFGALGEGVPVVLKVRQEGNILEAKDKYRATINKAPDGSFTPVPLGKISAGKTKSFKFDLWF